jgi:uncharacterized repeat protein (TIGR02543 family)
VQSTGVVARIYINNSLVATKTILGNGTSYTASTSKSVSASKSIAKTTSAQNIAWKVEFWQYTDGVAQSKKETLSGTASVKAKTKYTVTYNANGGSSTPAAQTKWYGTALTLAAAISRTGYTFQGWSTTSGGGVVYKASASYTANASVTLYAVWKANTYTITYHANGGSGAPASQTKTHDKALGLTTAVPSRANYTFLGWSDSSTATSAKWTAGGNYTTEGNKTLYAVWKLSYVKPKITSLSVDRCNSGKTLTDTGTYALVGFTWTTFIANPTITIQWKLSTATSYPTANKVTITGSGKGGTVSQIIGGGALNIDSTYSIYIKVADTTDISEVTRALPGRKFTIDRLVNGNGIAFGKTAELENTMDVGFLGRFREDVMIGQKAAYRDGNQGIYLDAEGFMHLQRSTEQTGNYPHVGFYGGTGTGSPDALIQYTHESDRLEFANAASYYFDNHMYFDNGKAICIANKSGAFMNMMTWNTSDNVHFAPGSYDGNVGDVYYDGRTVNIRSKTDIGFTIGSAGGNLFYPYYKSGDKITTTNVLYFSGYTNSAGKQLRLHIPLAKPAVGCGTVTISGGTWNAYQGGTAYSITPTEFSASVRSNTSSGNLYTGINLQVTFGNQTLVGNSPVGVYISGAVITFA